MSQLVSWTALFVSLFIIKNGVITEASLDCNPGKVTCCFTVDNALRRVFIDGKDVTDQIEPQQAFINWRKPKTITFDEPLHSSTIAIEGYVYNALESNPSNSGLLLTCSCTRPNSPWNFATGPNSHWDSVPAIGLNKLPENWHRYEYSGIVSRSLESDAGFYLNWAQCSSPVDEGLASMARKVAAAPSTVGLFTFRKQIEQDPALLVCPASKPPPPLPESNHENEPCGTVTCCMTADNEIVAAYIDGVEVTSSLEPNGDDLAIWTRVKQVTFDETPSSKAIIAVLGRDRESTHSPDKSGIQVMCTATRETSAWNFVRTFDGSQIWESVPVDATGSAPSLWFSGNYSGPSTKAVKSTSKFFMRTPICGPIDKFRKVAAEESSTTSFFALRASFPQTKTCVLSTNRPPTVSPTARDPFQFELELQGTVDSSSKSIARDLGGWGGVDVEPLSTSKANEVRKAVGYWESTIIRSFPTSVCIPAGTVLCGYRFPSERCFADILVLVSTQSGLTANSETMVCGTDVTGRPRAARIILSKSLSTENVHRVAIHAMAHALGFGTMWGEFDVVDQTLKTYTGIAALDEFKSLGNRQEQLEVEIAGNGLGHWHSNSLPNELMNRQYSSANPISTVTLMSFFDLLYEVNMSMAEPYSLSKQASIVDQKKASIVQEPEATSDISIIDMVLLPSTVKPGRQAEYERDLEAKRLRDDRRAARGTSSNGELALNIGAIIGISVGAILAIGAVVLFLVVRSRRNSSKNNLGRSRRQGRRPSTRRSGLFGNAASPPADQHGWMEKFDVENNTTYWINQFTGEFSWSNPNPAVNEPRSPPVSASEIVVMAQPDFGGDEEQDDNRSVVIVGTDWQETVDEASHARYFIKPKTGEFSWVMPPQ